MLDDFDIGVCVTQNINAIRMSLADPAACKSERPQVCCYYVCVQRHQCPMKSVNVVRTLVVVVRKLFRRVACRRIEIHSNCDVLSPWKVRVYVVDALRVALRALASVPSTNLTTGGDEWAGMELSNIPTRNAFSRNMDSTSCCDAIADPSLTIVQQHLPASYACNATWCRADMES
ncbi:MAG: hypothetical protein OXQ29_07885 [Rhodospirillaceae bacterium]|nr:hypothetical protein [Rhodospirillaceae bacterium]